MPCANISVGTGGCTTINLPVQIAIITLTERFYRHWGEMRPLCCLLGQEEVVSCKVLWFAGTRNVKEDICFPFFFLKKKKNSLL